MLTAKEQFTHDEHRPALIENFHRLGDRTVLAIGRHFVFPLDFTVLLI
jgi:hypothetical protein